MSANRVFACAFPIFIVVSLTACRAEPRATITPALVEQNNRAVGLMGQFDFNGAVDAFTKIGAAAPDWPGARLNLAIALMNRQGTGDEARAEALLRELLNTPEVGRRARYALGLLLVHGGRDAEALPLLTEVANADPPDAFAAYFIGQIKMSDAPAEALEWHRRAAAQQPLLRSAYYGAFLASRRLNREADAAAMLERFQALERHPQAMVAEFKYTRMGPLSEAITVDDPAAPLPSAPTGPRFASPVPLVDAGVAWRRGGRPRSVTVANLDADEALDVFIADAVEGVAPNAVLVRRDSRYVVDALHPLARVPGVRAALWGDLDDDGLVDVVLCRAAGGTQIWKQSPAGRWTDVTASTGIRLARTDIVDGAVFDADHDGDLDIWLVNAAGPNELLNNDGGGRFRAIGRTAAVAGDGRPSRGVAVADLDNDRDTDVIVIKDTPPHDIFLNGRVWEYRRDDKAAALASVPFTALVAGDFDANGEAELYTAGARGSEQWRRDESGTWRAAPVAPAAPAALASRLAIADTDGDGAMELLSGAPAAADAPLGWAIAHFDSAAGPSLVGVRDTGEPVVWGPGPGRHRFIALRLTGRDPKSDQRRSNVSGLGARVAVRTGSRWTAFENTRFESGPGQSLQPISIGLGGASRADFAAITWSDGVFQTELALDAGRLHILAETQRQLSSCPVLFAWDGTGFRFVTDVLGVGGIGFFESPGVYSTPFPRENVLLPSEAVVPSGGAYRLKLAEPMEEVTYLDHASLVAYDLPPGWRMALDERKAITGPAPTGAPLFYRDEFLASHAVNDRGEDVTAKLAVADLSAAGPAHIDARFIGLARPHDVTLTFDAPVDRGRGRPILLIDGWIEYPYAQTVFAAWQAGAVYEPPTLEARDRHGRWHTVAPQFGYPAGMPRQMALPLPALPAGATALRLRTAQEIYWDRIAVVYAEPLPAVQRKGLPLRAAALESDGFATRTTGPQRAPHYNDRARLPLDDTRHQRGWYTEFGRIDPLVADEDHAVAIFGPGEAVVLDFEAPAAAPAEGWTRVLVLELRGWCKDMDLYTLDGDTIEPLPGRNTAARASLHPRFNTRYAAGF
ncbi:MAG TPA: FG-GAP-like repeat-containing protein [Vicinamibacterales bacterium]|nr:FG-GAP-like repeat-containing protein [Vicinamibacterales bacterium]